MTEDETKQLYCLLEKAIDGGHLEVGVHTLLDNGELGNAVSMTSKSITVSASLDDRSILLSMLSCDYNTLGAML